MRTVLHAHARGLLRYARRAFSRARYALVLVLFRFGSDGQADAGDAPARALAAGLLAARAHVAAVVAAAGGGKDSAVGHGGGLRRGNDPRPRQAVAERPAPDSRAAGQCLGLLGCLSETVCLPDGFGRFLSSSGNSLPLWKVAGSLLAPRRAFAGGDPGATEVSVLLRRLVLVPGDARAGERIGPDWRSGDGRPLHLPAADRLGPGVGVGASATCPVAAVLALLRDVVAALVILILAVCAWRQTGYWHDSETLWNRALSCTTGNACAHYNLGVTLMERGQKEEAIAHFQEVVTIEPHSADALNNIGIVMAEGGHLDQAIANFRQALRYRPDDVDAHNNLATALKLQGKSAEAVDQWREVVRLQPNNPEAVNRLAWASATAPKASVRNGTEAVELARWAVMLSHGREAKILCTLAAAYAENGQFPQAVQTAHQALTLATRQKQQPLAASLKAQLSCYERGKPFREPLGP